MENRQCPHCSGVTMLIVDHSYQEARRGAKQIGIWSTFQRCMVCNYRAQFITEGIVLDKYVEKD